MGRTAKERIYSDKEKRIGAPVRISVDAHSKAVKLSQSSKMNMKAILSYLIDICAEFDLLNPAWQQRINAAMDKGSQFMQQSAFERLDAACAALCFGDRFWKCIWGNDAAPPSIKNLARELDEALSLCKSCDKTRKMKGILAAKDLEIQTLENRLNARQLERYKIPVCAYGATLNHDATNFTGCRVKQGQAVSIEGFCKVRHNGLKCNLFSERVVGVGVKDV